MRIHLLAMVALLTAAAVTGCDSAREVRSASTHANAWGCDQCHGYPPPPFFPADAAATHPAGLTPPMCTVCHPRTVMPDGHSILAGGEHRDGQVEYIDYKTVACTSCHATPPDTGKHLFHVRDRGLQCSVCHLGFDPDARTADDAVHMNGKPDVIADDGSAAGVVIPTADLPTGEWTTAECATCHAALHVTQPPE
jgi:hypothetical protein